METNLVGATVTVARVPRGVTGIMWMETSEACHSLQGAVPRWSNR